MHAQSHKYMSAAVALRTIDTFFVSIRDSWIAYQKVKPNVSPIAAIYFNLLLALCILSHDFVIFLRCLPAYYYYLIWFNMKISHCYWCSNMDERAGTEHHQCLLCVIYIARTTQHCCTNTDIYIAHITSFAFCSSLSVCLCLCFYIYTVHECMCVIIVHYVL